MCSESNNFHNKNLKDLKYGQCLLHSRNELSNLEEKVQQQEEDANTKIQEGHDEVFRNCLLLVRMSGIFWIRENDPGDYQNYVLYQPESS